MIRHAMVLTAALMLAACASSEAKTGETEGRAAAEKNIAEGNPQLVFIGLPDMDRHILDRETGLPTHSMGCVVSDRSYAFMESYNRTIREALDAGRLEGMTLGHKWITGEEMERHLAGEGFDVVIDGPEVAAPNGRFAVYIKRHIGESPYVFVNDLEAGERAALMYLGDERARIHFAHEGTTLIVRDDAYERTFTIDLPRRQELQNFPDDR